MTLFSCLERLIFTLLLSPFGESVSACPTVIGTAAYKRDETNNVTG